MDKELIKMLKAREQRWEMRKTLAEKLRCCIVTITLCVPLAFRVDEEYWELFQRLYMAFYEMLIVNGHHVNFEGCMRSDDGPAIFISTDSEAKTVKRICVEAEETIPGGRILDIDVMDREGNPIGRSDIDLPPRKCFLCENPAALCVSRKLHPSEEISAWVKQLKKQAEII